ncbi:MAG TPA: 50S ribosomal protein L9 [Acidobacteriota bacterium]|jgi:large subunit ribosomal protein L9
MEIILREDVDNVGKRGEVVKVSDGFARNYLLRRKLAMPFTPGNVKTFEVQKEALALREQKEKSDSEIVAAELEKLEAIVSRKAGESGALFGSVTAANVSELLAARGIRIDKRKIQMREPLKALGHYKVPVRLHREVLVEFPLYVVGESQKESEGIRERRAAPPPEEAPAPEPKQEESLEAAPERTERKERKREKKERKSSRKKKEEE